MASDQHDHNERIRQFETRFRKFGAARSPLDLEIDNERIVVAGPQLFRIPLAWTFHEFLISYGLSRIGRSIVNQERDRLKPLHPLAKQLLASRVYIAKDATGKDIPLADDKLFSFIRLSWDIFTVSDNTRLQDELVNRMHNADLYQGARYELFVAASFLRSGFKIEFENESDSTTSHCELTATHPATGKAYSVEAKSRHRPSESYGETAGVYRLLQNALKKNAVSERIVFIDVNLPHDERALFDSPWHEEVAHTLNQLELSQRPDDPWPQAIVFFTNGTFSRHPHSDGGISTMLVTAINHPLFKQSERSAVESAYPDVGKLCHAVDNLGEPPAEFLHQEPRS